MSTKEDDLTGEFLIAIEKGFVRNNMLEPCKPSPQGSAEDTDRTRSHGNRLLDSSNATHQSDSLRKGVPWTV